MAYWRIDPLDTFFIKNGLSMNAGESGWVESLFPPPPQTIQGMVRSAVLLDGCPTPRFFQQQKCHTAGCSKKDCSLSTYIGSPKPGDYGSLDLNGPYIIKNDIPYFPIPLDIVRENEALHRSFILEPATEEVECDLGKIRLPDKPPGKDYGAFKPVAGWISFPALANYLRDRVSPQASDIIENVKEEGLLYTKEPRVGISRDSSTHRIKKGQLYSIVPLRLAKDCCFGLTVKGIPPNFTPRAMRLGGENRWCRVTVEEKNPLELEVDFKAKDKRIKLVLLQAADFEGSAFPIGFTGLDSEGEIEGVRLRLISAAVGKPQKLGGWDIAKKRPKEIANLVPAGSVYYFELLDDGPATIKSGKIGLNTKIGYGWFFTGRW